MMKLTKKNVHRLLDVVVRKRILSCVSKSKAEKLKMHAYAEHLVAEQIAARDNTLKSNNGSFYGFPPLIAVSAMLKDGKTFSFMLECNVINFFLRNDDNDSAIEAAECILAMLAQERPDIRDFDIEDIKKAEQLMLAAQMLNAKV